jgi:SAM-dependent methyltransferase
MEAQADLNTLTQEININALTAKNTIIFKLLEKLALETDAKVLEIGPDSTEHLPYLFQKAANISYSGIFEAESVTKEAFSTYQAEGNTIKLIKRTDNRIDFQDNFFDSCFTVNTIYFWPDPLQYLTEIYRTLKPKGTINLAFVEKNFGAHLPWTQLDFTFYEMDEVKLLFKQTGFVNIEIQEMAETITDKDGNELCRPFMVISGQK